MEQSRTPEGGRFNQMIVDLMESDKETYDLWDMRHNHNLRGDYPANLKVLHDLLLEAIQKKGKDGWVLSGPKKEYDGSTIFKITTKRGSEQVSSETSFSSSDKIETVALLNAYLSALED